jgi:uncharacterized membrane protein
MTNSSARVALLTLCGIPLLAGAARLHEISGGIVTSENARFLASPFPVQAHILSASVFSVLGAIQLTPGRESSFRIHRILGGIAVLAGVLVALTGLWMTLFYPAAGFDGAWVFGLRLIVGVAMVCSLIAAVAAIGRRQFAAHGAWMIRAYALGMGAGTQVITHLPGLMFPMIQGETSRALSMAAGWGINLLIAEWLIRRSPGGATTRSVADSRKLA